MDNKVRKLTSDWWEYQIELSKKNLEIATWELIEGGEYTRSYDKYRKYDAILTFSIKRFRVAVAREAYNEGWSTGWNSGYDNYKWPN